MATDDEDEGGSGNTRSPRYPAMSLKDAVAKVKAIYDADKTAGSPLKAALGHMGYTAQSGPANAAIAALRRFGLVESRSGRVVPTARAIAILKLPETDQRRKTAIRDAVLAPSLYKTLLEQYKDTGLPSQASLEQELCLDERFNHNRIPGLVKDFLDSLKFAGLVDETGVLLTQRGDDEGDGDDSSGSLGDAEVDSTHEKTKPERLASGFSSPKAPAGTRDFPLYTSKSRGALFVPERMSPKDFELLKRQIENSLAVIEATAVSEDG
jgi:hypothetical protein